MSAKRNALRVLLPVLVLALGVAASVALKNMREEVEPSAPPIYAPLVEVHVANSEPVQLQVRTHGTVFPRSESRIVSEVDGRIVELSPTLVNGGFFEDGDLLVRIDDADYVVALAEADRRVAAAERQLAQEVADAQQARRDWEKFKGEQEAPALVLREPQLAQAQADLRAAEAALEKAKRDVERCSIHAPYAGRVRMEQVELDEYVMPGQELARIYAVDFAEVRLPLPDAELAFLDLPLSYRGEEQTGGPKVELTARFAGSDHRWDARIVRTEGELDPTSRMVVAIASVPDPYGRNEEFSRPPLAIGLFVEATIEGRYIENAIVLPRAALRSGGRVYVLAADSTLEIRDVEVLKAERERVVIANGVAVGEEVITTSLETVTDGMEVRVVGSGQ